MGNGQWICGRSEVGVDWEALIYVDEERSVMVNGEGRDNDLWAAGSSVRTTLLRLTVKTS